MKIIVFGANGFLGKKICSSLSKENDVLRTSITGTQKGFIQADITSEKDIAKVMQVLRF